MDLSNDLISKFVKITSEQNNKKTKEGIAYGTIVEFEHKMYVKLDGSDLLTPINSTSDVKDGERVTIMIKDHNAVVTGNITSPSASSGDVKKVTEDVTTLGGEIAEFETVVANKVGVDELDAEVARINNLIAGRATIDDLNATNAEIVNLQAKDAEIVNLVAGKAEIDDLTAANAEIENLKAKNVEITSLVAGKANISDLTAINADIVDLKAKDIETDKLIANKASISDLTATNATIDTLDARVASIDTLVNGNLTSDNILSFNITSKNTTMENAFIKDAMIDQITASKIMSGTIDTNNVSIQSTDGSMLLQGTLLQMKDDNGKVRIQIGKDNGGNFTFVLYDETGKGVLIDEEGIKSSDAIADGLIVDAKVADNANISGAKLDIASVITEVNKDNSTTIKSNKIYLDEQNQSLEVAFNTLKTQVETIQDVTIDGDLSGIVEQVQSNTTQIETNKEGISTLVAENIIRTEEISDLEGEIQQVNTSMSNKYSSLEQDISGFKTTVNNTYATKSSVDGLTKVYATKTELSQTNDSIVAKFSESGGYNLIRNSTGACGNTNGWTHTATEMGVKPYDNIGSASKYYLYLDNGTTTTKRYAYSSRFKLKPNTTYRFTGYFHNYTKCSGFEVFILSSTSLTDTDTSTEYTNEHSLIAASTTKGTWKKYTTTFTTPKDTKSGILRIDNNGYNESGTNNNRVHWSCLILTEGSMEVPWSPHPSEVYDGITQIDKDGIKVSQSNYNGYTQMKADGFYVNNGSENVISITKDGSYFKGKVVITSNGSKVPTSVLDGSILSTQLDTGITTDISTAKTNASTAVSTANAASTNASNAVKTANTASTNASSAVSTANTAKSTAETAKSTADTAKSTADTAKSTADSVKSTVDSGKTKWNNAYDRVDEWAYGAVTGSTTIDGGFIQANTIVSDKIAVADFTNYADLNTDTLSKWGWSSVADSSESNNPWFQRTSVNRSNRISKWYSCNGGETFRIKADIFTSTYGQPNSDGSGTAIAGAVGIMIYTKDADGNNGYYGGSEITPESTSGTTGTVNHTIKIPSSARQFAVHVRVNAWPTFSGILRVRNVLVNKMSNGELIVDGSITADKIASGAITAGKIAAGAITAGKIASGAITAEKIAANAITGKTITGGSITGSTIKGNTITGGTISGTSISGTTFTSSGTDGNSNQYQTMTLSSGALMLTGAIVGGTSDGEEANRTYLTSMGLVVKDSSYNGFGGNANVLYTNTGIYWNSKTTGGEEYPGWQQLIGYYDDYVLIDRLPVYMPNPVYSSGLGTMYTNIYLGPASNGEAKVVAYDSEWGAANADMNFRPIRASAFYRKDGKHAYINATGGGTLTSASSALVANGVRTDATDFYLGVDGRARVVNKNGYNDGKGLTYKPIMASAFENGSDLMFKKNIRTTDDLDVIDILNKVDVYRYDMIGGNENEIGLIAQACPSDLICGTPYDMDIQTANEITDEDRQSLVDPDNGGASVNLYHMASILWKVCKEQQKRIEQLENLMKGEE